VFGNPGSSHGALSVVAKMGTPDVAAKGVVKQYFGDSTTTDIKLGEIMTTLSSGYQKIANACNSSKIIISDEPIDRNGGGWKDWAFIYNAESMKVIYLQNAWLTKADEITPSNQSLCIDAPEQLSMNFRTKN